MRCADVIHELTAPTGAVDQEAMSDHLARCPRCAAVAQREAKFQQLWDASRPVPPTPDGWNPVWARISEALDQAPAPAVLPLVTRAAASPWSRRRIFLAVTRVAAAAVIVGVVAFRWYTAAPHPVVAVNPAPLQFEADVEQGEIAVFRVDAARKSVETIDLAQNDRPIWGSPVGEDLEMLNSLEGYGDEWKVATVQ